MDVKSGRFCFQSGRAGDEEKKQNSPAKSGRVGITVFVLFFVFFFVLFLFLLFCSQRY